MTTTEPLDADEALVEDEPLTMGEGRIAPLLMAMAVAGMALIVAVLAPHGPVTWIAGALGTAFTVLAIGAARAGDPR